MSLIPLLLIFISLVQVCSAAVYTVGDSAGWDVSADLDKWPVGKNFTVGDVLLFQYSSYHSVKVVDKSSFHSCSTANVLQSSAGGNTTIPLATAGDWYFICSVPSHCFGGMKLHVRVHSGQSADPAEAPAPSSDGNLDEPPVDQGGFSGSTRGYSGHAGRWCGVLVSAVMWALLPGL